MDVLHRSRSMAHFAAIRAPSLRGIASSHAGLERARAQVAASALDAGVVAGMEHPIQAAKVTLHVRRASDATPATAAAAFVGSAGPATAVRPLLETMELGTLAAHAITAVHAVGADQCRRDGSTPAHQRWIRSAASEITPVRSIQRRISRESW